MFRSLASGAVVSIHCRARRTAEPPRKRQSAGAPASTFLFAVVRDVQRNSSGDAGHNYQEFLFAVVRNVQRDFMRNLATFATTGVSIRCRARRTAEPPCSAVSPPALWFLFTVVRDVQRNPHVSASQPEPRQARFYSLSCETCSGTRPAMPDTTTRSFYSLSCETYSGTTTATVTATPTASSFYSLSCETYSGTPDHFNVADAGRAFLFAVVRDVQRNIFTSGTPAPTRAGFYSLSCETYSGTRRLRTA